MLLFCDTSALIKLLIDEPDSAQIHQASERAGVIAACRMTWAEAMAAMARRQREDSTSADEIDLARQRLIKLWPSFTIVEVSQQLVEAAGRFADGFALRGYDSVQLAAAHELRLTFGESVTFACYDRRLNQAAQLLQLEVLA
ncbi:type II toxin-antitoxin system VapC family toxin [Synechococcus sp. CBW1108]|nr:type II toxin-antitoxin system VapC family toxin [Synechococcus sp. CBW1108]